MIVGSIAPVVQKGLPLDELLDGLVVKEQSGFFWVEVTDGTVYTCRLLGKLMEEAQARHDQMVKEMEARRSAAPSRPVMSEEMSKRMEEAQARREQMIKEMEARREVAMKPIPFEAPVFPPRKDI